MIIERLEKEARKKALDTCPFFSLDKASELVAHLPDKIVPDNLYYRKYYIKDYKNGKAYEKAVNIRPDTKPPDLMRGAFERELLISKISIN